MADEMLVYRLKDDSSDWNTWREYNNPDGEIDLSDARLSDASLSGVNLRGYLKSIN